MIKLYIEDESALLCSIHSGIGIYKYLSILLLMNNSQLFLVLGSTEKSRNVLIFLYTSRNKIYQSQGL